MASLSKLNGSWRVMFVDRNGDRKAVWLGQIPKKAADTAKTHIEHLNAAASGGFSIENETIFWLNKQSDRLYAKLEARGLAPKRVKDEPKMVLLGEHLDAFFERRECKVKASTLVHWRHTKRCLLEYFGPERPLKSITIGDAGDFETWLKTGKARVNRYGDAGAGKPLALNTARKRISNAKQFFQDAVDRELIAKNPFAGLCGTVSGNRNRDYMLSREDAQKVIDACPDAEWRLIFALARYGGLRIPSELLALKWEHVDWTEGKFLVHSSKTEHYEGKGERWVPLFPELRPYLEDCWEPDAVYVINRYRDSNVNLRTQLQKIIYRADLTPWPKLFQNLRASRATELAAEYPAHVATAWLGHSERIATKHYWQITPEDFRKAAGMDLPTHFPAHSGAESAGLERTAEKPIPQKRGKNAASPLQSVPVQEYLWAALDSNQ